MRRRGCGFLRASHCNSKSATPMSSSSNSFRRHALWPPSAKCASACFLHLNNAALTISRWRKRRRLSSTLSRVSSRRLFLKLIVLRFRSIKRKESRRFPTRILTSRLCFALSSKRYTRRLPSVSTHYWQEPRSTGSNWRASGYSNEFISFSRADRLSKRCSRTPWSPCLKTSPPWTILKSTNRRQSYTTICWMEHPRRAPLKQSSYRTLTWRSCASILTSLQCTRLTLLKMTHWLTASSRVLSHFNLGLCSPRRCSRKTPWSSTLLSKSLIPCYITASRLLTITLGSPSRRLAVWSLLTERSKRRETRLSFGIPSVTPIWSPSRILYLSKSQVFTK